MNAARRALTRRVRDDDRGYVAIMVAVTMVVALGLAALVVDIGHGRQIRQQAQVAADASALAAVEEIADFGDLFTGSTVQWQDVVNEVKVYALNNYNVALGEWVGCTDPNHLTYVPDTANNNSCISADSVRWPDPQPGETTWKNRVRVRTPTRTIETVFGGAIDQDELSTQAVAMAAVTRKRTIVKTTVEVETAGGPCAICVLSEGFAFDGQNGDITVTGGGVVVNADPPTGWASYLNPNGHVRVTAAAGIGGPGAPAKWHGDGFDPAPVNKAAVADPLAAIPACGSTLPAPAPYASWPGCPSNTATATGKSGTLNPGVYTEISGTRFLNPGVYVITGGITLSGNEQITGYGVTLYFACDNYPAPCSDKPEGSRAGADIKATGNGALLLTGPTAAQCTTQASTCPYQGIVIFADRDNTSEFTFRGNGTNESGSATGSSGTIYMKSGTLDLRGNGYTLASQIITGNLTMEGNPSGITVAYDQSRNAPETTTETVPGPDEEAYSYDATGLEA